MGHNEPLVDLEEYFKDAHGITQVSLKEETARADDELRAQVLEVWQEAHERRRAGNEHVEVDPALVHRLADHDAECTVGVIVKRGSGSANALGYRYWFLTLDRTGVRFHHELELRLGKGRTPLSPLMSPDFMAQYLRLGPARSSLKPDAWAALPTLTDLSRSDFRPEDLIAKADEIRSGLQAMPDRVADRLVRDQMNKYRLRRSHD